MKTPPKDAEFARFTEAMRHIMTVPKAEIQRRHEESGYTPRPKPSVSRVSADEPKREG